MSIGNPKKFKNFDSLEKELNANEVLKKDSDNARLYKHKGARIEKALDFMTKKNKSKLT